MNADPTAPFPPRVLALLGGIVPIGGAERMIFAALEEFRQRGSAVHCIVNDWQNGEAVAAAERIGATWSAGPYNYRLRWKGESPRKRLRSIRATLRTSRDLLRRASAFRPSLIFASDFDSVLRNAVALATLRARGKPVVMYLQNAPPAGSRYKVLFGRVIAPLVTRFVAASHHSADELAKLGIAQTRISYVNNFPPSRAEVGGPDMRDPHRILFAGQMIPQKGLDILLEAVALIAKSHPLVHLDVAARTDGWIAPEYSSHRDAVLSRVERDDLRDRVSFLGWRDDVPSLLARSAVHCAPSRPEMREGMPLVCLEAKESATPTVAPSNGPFPEMIEHRVDGWLSETLSPAGLAAGLDYFLSDPQRAREAGEAAHASLARFNRREFSRRWQTVVAELRPAGGWRSAG